MKIGLVCSAGGHLSQLLLLRQKWTHHDVFWVTLDKLDARTKLAEDRVYYAHGPTNRNLGKAWKNLSLARSVLTDERPDVLVSNGAGVAVPFFVVARRRSIPTVFIEVYDRVEVPSLTGALLAPITSAVVAQWPEQLDAYPHATLLGPML
ncbi:MAG: UDP-N-acetylglucosamine--LPS N-acetylglucosamine transferase [Myxococcota bacterium]